MDMDNYLPYEMVKRKQKRTCTVQRIIYANNLSTLTARGLSQPADRDITKDPDGSKREREIER